MVNNLYRFQESLYTEGKLVLYLHTYPIIKTTKFGAWIDIFGFKKFILLNAKKRYACPTIEEALESYHKRKTRQVEILSYKLKLAKTALKLQKKMEK